MNARTQHRSAGKTPNSQLSRAKTSVSEPAHPNSRLAVPRHRSATNTQSHSTPNVQNGSNKSDLRQMSATVYSEKALKPLTSPVPHGKTGLSHRKEAFSGQDLKFTEVHTEPAGRPNGQQRSTVTMSASDILKHCNESDYKEVYEICLHCCHLGKIKNLERFTKLRILDLSSNRITVIENLSDNLDLRELKLYDNDIAHIANLEKLRDLLHLHLQHNIIRSVGCGLNGLSKLKVLRLDFNRLTQIDARELSPCSQLTSLNISNNCLDNIGAVASLPNLEELYVRHNILKRVCDLSRCKRLQEVDISYNPLTDLSGLKDILSLRILNVSHCQLTSFSTLGKLKDLEQINASHCQLRTIKALPQFYPSLQVLNVSHNLVASRDDLTALKTLNELVELSVSGNPFCISFQSFDDLVASIHAQLSQLHVLDSCNLLESPTEPRTALKSRASDPLHLLHKPLTSFSSPRPFSSLSRQSSNLSKISDREVERQISEIQTQLCSFEAEFSVRIQNLKSCLQVLPESVKSSQSLTQRSGSATGSKDARPPSRCGVKSRLQDAKHFADSHFENQ